MGCPIRTSTDQRLLAAPRGFSQRATSFIASWCQGIHRMPLSRSRSMTHPAPRGTRHAKPTIHSMQPSKLPPAIGTASIRFAPQAAMTGHSLSTKHIASERICPVARITPYGDSRVRQTATEARPETHQNLIHTCKDRTSATPSGNAEATATRTRAPNCFPHYGTWWRRSGSNR